MRAEIRAAIEGKIGKAPAEKTGKIRADKSPILQMAYRLLNVKPVQVDQVPRIEHLFTGVGGKSKIFEYLAGSDDPKAQEITKLRAKLTTQQARAVPFEAFCIAIGETTKRVFGLIAEEVMEQSRKAAALLRDAALADVVKTTIEQAKTPAGSQERRMLLQAGDQIPVPRTVIMPGGTINVDNRRTNIDARQQVAVLPPVEHTLRTIDRFNDRGTPAIAAPVEAEDEEEEDGDDETAG